MRRIAAATCLIGAIGATCLFFGPRFHIRVDDDGTTNRSVATQSLGLPSSPWWDYRQAVVNGEVVASEGQVRAGSASWLLLCTAILLYYAWNRLRTPKPSPVRAEGRQAPSL